MGVEYIAVQWNRQKRIYDFVLAGVVGGYLVLFALITKALFPFVTDEIAAFHIMHRATLPDR
jgi:hypothetical protein